MDYAVTRTEFFPEYDTVEFEFEGRPARLVKPNVKPNGKWALKTEYFHAFPETEKELLNRGWHIAYNKNDNRWAEPDDVERKVRFAEFVSEEFGLNKKCALVGMSCGGLYAARFSCLAPHLVSAMYIDAPVWNLLSCPCGLGDKTENLYEEYYKVTGRTISEMICYRESPIDKMDILLKNNLPVILVAGDSDEVVPFHENGAHLEKYYKENGGTIEVYVKKGCKHHPHGLDDVSIVADFLEKY